MDSLGNEKGGDNEPIKSNSPVDASDGETQFFDSQSWSPEFLGGMECGDGDELLKTTMLFDSTVMVEDAYETQVVDLAGETQVMDFGGETQVVDVCGETQVLDDVNYFETVETQLLDDFGFEDASESDGGGSDGTEVLGDKDDLTDDRLVREGDYQSVDKEAQCFPVCNNDKKLIEQPNVSSNLVLQNNAALHVPTATPVPQSSVTPKSGSGTMRFTSVRAASLRASGLAARNMALKGTKNASSSIPTTNMSSDKIDVTVIDEAVSVMELGKEGDQEGDLLRCNGTVNSSKDENTCKGGNLAARKLFTEDLDCEKDDLPHDASIDREEDTLKLSASDLAGLSYVDSQEPGELTQANALDFVDRFIKESVAEFDREIERGSTGGKSKCVSSIKGPQKLAKKANEKNIVGELGIYDWDDNREDEGGGDIFNRRKEEFFGGNLGRRPSKPRVNEPRKRQINGNDKRMDMFNSDAKLLLRNRKVDKKVYEPKRNFRRNLINELDKQSDIDFQDKQLEKNATKADASEMLDVGFDTQMAAEAMEALFNGEEIANRDVNDACEGIKKSREQPSSRKRARLNVAGHASSQPMKTRRVGATSNNMSSVSSEKQPKNVRKQRDVILCTMDSKNTKENVKKQCNSNGSEDFKKTSHDNIEKRKAGSSERGVPPGKKHMQEKVGSLEPIDHRTRCVAQNKNRGIRASIRLASSEAQLNKTENIKSKSEVFEKMEVFTKRSKNHAFSCPRRRRSSRNLSPQVNKSDNIDHSSEPSALPEVGQSSNKHKRSCRETRSSVVGQPLLSSADPDLEGKLPRQRSDRVGSGNTQSVQTSVRLGESPREKSKPSDSSCTTPLSCKVPVSEISPVCMGDEYLNQSCRRSLSKSLLREIQFSARGPLSISSSKDLRKRREITDVRILYSNHLDDNVIQRQKKILARLGVSVASSIKDATHFIADQFVRTRNMLETIASGKPVVTHSWIESCGQANCFIDEKNYILRDSKKEKEFGFSMPTSLACASQDPLLQGLKVLVTQNTKPGKETIASLVKAVQGKAVERIGRSALKDGALPDDLLILSCEEDYEICVPFLEKGATIYSSELLLNGIVTQRLEYERYRLFTDHLRITRSTIRLKKDGSKFLPVTKSKRD